MKFQISSLLLVLFFLLSLQSFAQTTKTDQKRALDAYISEQKNTNGGELIKKEFFSKTIEQRRAKYIKLIDEAMTLEEYYGYWPKTKRKVLPVEEFEQLMIGLTAEFNDGHHNTMRISSSHWDLGLKTAVIQGKLYVTGINEKTYTPGRFGRDLNIGDEIVSINGKPVHELKKEFLLYTRMFSGTYEAQEIMALESMVSRSGRYLRSVKDGESALIGMKRGGEYFEGELNWVDASKLSDDIQFYAGLNPNAPKNFEAPVYRYGMMSQRSSQFRLGIEALGLPNGAITEIGELVNFDIANELKKIPSNTHSRLPVGEVKRLQAYTVQVNDQLKVGVIRIPSYSPASYLDVMREFNWMAEVIDRMNNSGVAYFVMDANSNGGGYVNYVSHLMRFFAFGGDVLTGSANIKLTKTYLQMLKQASIDGIGVDFLADYGQSGVDDAHNMVKIEDIAKEHNLVDIKLRDYFGVVQESFADRNQLRILYEKFQKLYDEGKRWSGQYPYMGITNGITEGSQGRSSVHLNPVFTKPVVFLNDVRSASGGDYAPAILVANDRALVVGDTSRGLGMPVFRNQPALPGSEMYTRNPYAFSLLPGGLPLENIGAVPHIRREIFHADLLTNFSQYAMDVINAGYYYANGKTIEEISQIINSRVQKFLTSNKELPAELGEIFEASAKLEQEVSFVTSLAKREEAAAKYIELYKDFNFLLEVAKESNLSEYGHLIQVPLPGNLIADDMMLASVFRSRSVVDRLDMLLKHSKYKNMPKTKELFKLLIQTFSTLENVSTTNDCNTLFKALERFKIK